MNAFRALAPLMSTLVMDSNERLGSTYHEAYFSFDWYSISRTTGAIHSLITRDARHGLPAWSHRSIPSVKGVLWTKIIEAIPLYDSGEGLIQAQGAWIDATAMNRDICRSLRRTHNAFQLRSRRNGGRS